MRHPVYATFMAVSRSMHQCNPEDNMEVQQDVKISRICPTPSFGTFNLFTTLDQGREPQEQEKSGNVTWLFQS